MKLKIPSPPKNLSPAAKRVWRRTLPHLMVHQPVIDMEEFGRYCEAEVICVQRTIEMNEASADQRNAADKWLAASDRWDRALTTMLRLAKKFGMSPLSRAKMRERREKRRRQHERGIK